MKEIKSVDKLVQHLREDADFYGYRADLEDREGILRGSLKTYSNWRATFADYEWEPPEEIDPRGWYDIHDQGPVGSCQGQSLADCGEYLNVIATGVEVQLSRGFAYLASQEFDRLIGRDNGSTLSGGTKAAARGIPLEDAFEYTANYRDLLSRYQRDKDKLLAGKLWKYPAAIAMPDYESCYRWLSSWTGVIQIGIGWSLGNARWEVESYRSGGGGHAVNLTGYLKRPGWTDDRGILLKNSHSKQWGKDGWALIHPKVVDSWCRNQTVVGRSDMRAPAPRIESKEHYGNVVAA